MKRGFTIMEIMIVIVIVGLMSAGAVFALGATARAQLQSASWMIVSASKYAYARAVSRGSTVRMVIDFSDRSIQLQETYGRVVLNRDDETGVGLNRADSEDEFLPDGTVKEGDDKDKLKDIGPKIAGSSLSDGSLGSGEAQTLPITDAFLKSLTGETGRLPKYQGPTFEVIEGSRGKKRKFKGSVGFLRVFSPHAPTPIEEGYAFIYFFPGGITEHTFIQLSDFDDDEPVVKTIEIHPLSGKGMVYHEEREPEEDLEEMQEAER